MVTRPLNFGERRIAQSMSFHPDVLEAVKYAAWRQRKTLSRFVNDVLLEWLEAHNDSNSVVGSQ